MQAHIVLSYRKKLLLYVKKENTLEPEKNIWELLDKKTVSKTIARRLNYSEIAKNLLHAELTDDDVNNMKRKTGTRLDFYKISELDTLTLSETSFSLISDYKDQIKDHVK